MVLAKQRVFAAADEVARSRAEAQWCNGYRARGGDTPQMREKENGWWVTSSFAQRDLERALTHLIRTARKPR